MLRDTCGLRVAWALWSSCPAPWVFVRATVKARKLGSGDCLNYCPVAAITKTTARAPCRALPQFHTTPHWTANEHACQPNSAASGLPAQVVLILRLRRRRRRRHMHPVQSTALHAAMHPGTLLAQARGVALWRCRICVLAVSLERARSKPPGHGSSRPLAMTRGSEHASYVATACRACTSCTSCTSRRHLLRHRSHRIRYSDHSHMFVTRGARARPHPTGLKQPAHTRNKHANRDVAQAFIIDIAGTHRQPPRALVSYLRSAHSHLHHPPLLRNTRR